MRICPKKWNSLARSAIGLLPNPPQLPPMNMRSLPVVHPRFHEALKGTWRSWPAVLVLAWGLSTTCTLFAQEPAPASPDAVAPSKAAPDEPQSPAAKFAELHRQWKAINTRLDTLQTQYRTAATPAVRAEVKKQYEELVAESNELLPQVGEAAEAAYVEKPNQDPEVTRMLIGLVAYEFRRDEYEQALRLAKLLESHGCDEAVLYDVAGSAAFHADDYATAEAYLTRADKAGKLGPTGRQLLAGLSAQKQAWEKEQEIRAKEAAADDLPRVKLETSKGTMLVELYENEAPETVGNFVNLVEKGFYDGLTFHRVLPGFMAQGGDPQGTGGGGPGYEIYCECDQENYRKHFRGTLSMAHAGKNTGGSQFFLTFKPTTHLNGRHTAFGRVIEGIDVLAKLQRIDPDNPRGELPDKIVKAEVVRKRDHAYKPTKVK
jgi:cyclophilin family peptidyl-prolyl cis-trans isomerase